MPGNDYDDDPLDSGPGPAAGRRRESATFKILRQSAQYQAEMRSDVREVRRDVEKTREDMAALFKAVEDFDRQLLSMQDHCAVASMPIERPPEQPPQPPGPRARSVTEQIALNVTSNLPWAALFVALCVAAVIVYGRTFTPH